MFSHIKYLFVSLILVLLVTTGCKDSPVGPQMIKGYHAKDKNTISATMKKINETDAFMFALKNNSMKQVIDKIPNSTWFKKTYMPLPIEGLERTLNGYKVKEYNKDYISNILTILRDSSGVTKLVNDKWIYTKTIKKESILEATVDKEKIKLRYYKIFIGSNKIKFTFDVSIDNKILLSENYVIDGENFTNNNKNIIKKIFRDGSLINARNIKLNYTYQITESTIKFNLSKFSDANDKLELQITGKKFTENFLQSKVKSEILSSVMNRKNFKILITKKASSSGIIGEVLVDGKLKAKIINNTKISQVPFLAFKYNSRVQFWNLISYLNW